MPGCGPSGLRNVPLIIGAGSAPRRGRDDEHKAQVGSVLGLRCVPLINEAPEPAPRGLDDGHNTQAFAPPTSAVCP